jgi:hypothetical protein
VKREYAKLEHYLNIYSNICAQGTNVEELTMRVNKLENMLRATLTRGFEKRLTKEAAEELLKGEGLEKRAKKEYVAED